MGLKSNKIQLAIFVLIPLIPLVLFWIFPMIASLLLSFTNWDYISPTYDIVGLKNYIDLLSGQAFQNALFQTLYFTFFSVIPIIVLGFIVAVMIHRLSKTAGFARGLVFAPYITPMIGMSIVFSWLFNAQVGPINEILGALGLPQPNWFAESPQAMWVIILITIWKNVEWASIFYADAFSRIPSSLFEVADVEGLSGWQKIRSVLIPLSSPTTIFLVIVSTFDCLQAYDQINVLTQGGPAGTTRTLLYLFYELGFNQFNMGQATALAMVILVISGILAFILIRVSRKYTYY